MSAPQMKERPASLLRAMFAGFGSLMSVMDKVRSKPAAEAPAATATPAPEDTATAEATAAPADNATPESVAETTAKPETSAESETVAAEAPAQPETSAAQETSAATEPSAASETGAAPETTDDSAASSALPLANYDELSVASLRARLRNLSNDDLNQLMTHEKANQNRPEVVKMFQNRLIKMTSGLPKLEA